MACSWAWPAGGRGQEDEAPPLCPLASPWHRVCRPLGEGQWSVVGGATAGSGSVSLFSLLGTLGSSRKGSHGLKTQTVLSRLSCLRALSSQPPVGCATGVDWSPGTLPGALQGAGSALGPAWKGARGEGEWVPRAGPPTIHHPSPTPTLQGSASQPGLGFRAA